MKNFFEDLSESVFLLFLLVYILFLYAMFLLWYGMLYVLDLTKTELKKVYSFTKAVYQFIRRGCKRVSPICREQRLSTCLSCKLYHGLKCDICGCYVHLKTWCIDEKCPIDKW